MERIRILLADDHRIFLEGLRELISQQPGLHVVATAENGEELLVKMRSYHVDLVILDIQMPKMNGIAAAAEMRRRFPQVPMLVLSMHSERHFIQRVFDIGVQGFLLKNTGKAELVEAIRSIHAGERYFREDAALALLEGSRQAAAPGETPPLSKRETEILILIAREHSNAEIAGMLHLSVETINTHRKNLLHKLGAKNTAGLVKYAIFQKLITS
jgi:DNA-binding NarL/FixJ family response regulator